MALIFNIQRFCVQDGPGVRTTVFLKGCQLRCLWCSNPESQNIFPEIAHRDSICKKCGHCVKVCPLQAVSQTQNGITIDRTKCNNCSISAKECVSGAIKVYGQEMSAEEVYHEAKRDIEFYENSGGGVTCSGGEPLLQADFTSDLFKLCKEDGIQTCLETCGYASFEALDRVLPYTNLVLFDLKVMNEADHRKFTGVANGRILSNLKYLSDKGVSIIIRIPVIPGINDSNENLQCTARYISELDHIKQVNLLQYHRLGESKYRMLDRHYQLGGLTPQDFSELEKLKGIFIQFDLDCEIVK